MNNKIKYVGIVALIIIAVFVGILTRKNQEMLVLDNCDEEIDNSGTSETVEIMMEEINSDSVEVLETGVAQIIKICVYVCGEVKSPDVYYLDAGARVVDAVDAAGGFSENAAKAYINLAGFVTDGAKIYIPSKEEVSNQSIETKENQGNIQNDGLINLNSASKEELMTLPGVGESKADSIIKYRESSGNFKTIEEIMNISGIKEGLFNKIKDLIKV